MKIISGTNWRFIAVSTVLAGALSLSALAADEPTAVVDPSPTPSPAYTEVMANDPTPTPSAAPIDPSAPLENRVGNLESRVAKNEQDITDLKTATPTPVVSTPQATPEATPAPKPLDPCKFPNAEAFYAAGGHPGEACTSWPKA